jgi:ATP-dependent Clp protease protease subunit
MELNTAEGGVLTIERENGEPQIGDKAQPDGEHEMPDGRVIVVEDGVITDIKTPEEEVTEEQEQEEDETEALRKEVEELRAELEEARKMAKSKDDLRILNAVKMAGGEQALKCFASSYVPEVRKRDGKEAKDKAESMGEPSPMRLEIEARKKGEFKRK